MGWARLGTDGKVARLVVADQCKKHGKLLSEAN
jgi:hypothetical protein